MNKTVSIKLPILALAMVFTISCSSDKDSGENPGPGGENSNVSNEQSSSSVVAPPSSSSFSSVQSSSSHTLCAPPMVGTGTEYVTGCAILEPHFTDARDGEIYRYAEIGTQTWMADNLNYDVPNNDTDVCYDNDPANCTSTKYGRLYNWATAMALPSKCNSTPTSGADCAIKNTNHQGICPSGWHIPSNSEWDALYRFVDGTSGTDSPYESPTAGKDLKAKFAWIDCGPSGSGEDYLCEDTHRFSARPGGYGWADGYFNFVGSNGSWWSASEWSSYSAYLRSINHYDEGASYKSDIKNNLYSVRCIRDN